MFDVIQTDRERAADLTSGYRDPAFNSLYVVRGERDDHPLVQAFARHRLEATQQAGWQGIASAPRDGTRFLAYEDGNHYALEWCPEGPGDDGYWKSYCAQYVTITPDPTHWQPLPAAPSATRPAWVAAS